MFMYFINVHSEYFMSLKLFLFIYILSILRIWGKQYFTSYFFRIHDINIKILTFTIIQRDNIKAH